MLKNAWKVVHDEFRALVCYEITIGALKVEHVFFSSHFSNVVLSYFADIFHVSAATEPERLHPVNIGGYTVDALHQ